jgi:hypothetical protein
MLVDLCRFILAHARRFPGGRFEVLKTPAQLNRRSA